MKSFDPEHSYSDDFPRNRISHYVSCENDQAANSLKDIHQIVADAVEHGDFETAVLEQINYVKRYRKLTHKAYPFAINEMARLSLRMLLEEKRDKPSLSTLVEAFEDMLPAQPPVTEDPELLRAYFLISRIHNILDNPSGEFRMLESLIRASAFHTPTSRAYVIEGAPSSCRASYRESLCGG